MKTYYINIISMTLFCFNKGGNMYYKEEAFLNIYPDFEIFVDANLNITNNKEVAENCISLMSELVGLVLKHNGDLKSCNNNFPNEECYISLLTNDETNMYVNHFIENIQDLPRIKNIIKQLGIIYSNNI